MGERIRVLLADDHVVLREATAELVDHQPDMEVVGQAATGEETIAQVRESHPDVVIVDIAMPCLKCKWQAGFTGGFMRQGSSEAISRKDSERNLKVYEAIISHRILEG